MEITIERTELWFYSGSSDKVYNVELRHNTVDDTYSVYFEYGRRGSNLVTGFKAFSNADITTISKNKAKKTYESLIRSKTKKGYTIEDVSRGDQQQLIDAYKEITRNLTADGIITYPRRVELDKFLESGDPETIKLAISILDAKNPESAA